MRVVCWNVNGLRTLKGFQPWYKLASWEACLEELGADIACFQEVKMTRKQLQYSMCVMDKYEAFYDLHPLRGYAGTATYVRKDICIPVEAQMGITGVGQRRIGGEAEATCASLSPDLYAALDAEGRSVVLDCGLFVLINVYAPNETGPERVEYKMAFYHALEERVRQLIDQGREVIVVGDMNAVVHPQDHCEGAQLVGEQEQAEFMQHPARQWIRALLAKDTGLLIDITRARQPDRKKMYTCWNTLIDARPANYGTRLDYTLISPGLLPWVVHADIQPEIYGSDHCPVFLELKDTIETDKGVERLVDRMHGLQGTSPGTVPRLAASELDEFSARKQPKLAAMFGAQRTSTKVAETKDTIPPPAAPAPAASPPRASPPGARPALNTPPSRPTPKVRQAPLRANKKGPAQPSLTSFFGAKEPKRPKSPSPPPKESQEAKRQRLAMLTPMPSDRQPEAAAQWNTLFTPQPPPLCTMHREPAKSWIVNKPGVNQGRKFWLCSRPVGPGYEGNKSSRAQDGPSLAYRCDYFAWDSDVKKKRPKD